MAGQDARIRDRVCSSSDELCLSFANTRYWRGSADPTESLNGYSDLLAWCTQAHVCETIPKRLRCLDDQNPRTAATLFQHALAAREAIYRLAHALAAGQSCSQRDLYELNQLLANAPGRSALALRGTLYGWRLPAGPATLEQLLAPVLWSAGDLLTGPSLQRLRCCANEQCGWLFLDDSKSGTRRWCMMSACGNRAKARRHYLKTRQNSSPLR